MISTAFGNLIPNPYAPMAGAVGPELSQSSVQRQRGRRAAMLATARHLLAEVGLERFTLRSISERCEVTVQTIHNSFGCRMELLMSALNEHTTSMENVALSESAGPMLFINLAQMYYRCAIETPNFLRQMVSVAFSTKHPLHAMQRHGTLHKATLIRKMAQCQILRDDVNAEFLAGQITRVNTFAVYEWAQHDNAAEFRRQILWGNKLLLMGALRTPGEIDVGSGFDQSN